MWTAKENHKKAGDSNVGRGIDIRGELEQHKYQLELERGMTF